MTQIAEVSEDESEEKKGFAGNGAVFDRKIT